MKKTLRNKALKDIHMLITATYHGEEWAAPSGYFAVKYPIYDGYKIKKSQRVMDTKPMLDIILDDGKEYIMSGGLAWEDHEGVTDSKNREIITERVYYITSTELDARYKVETTYLKLILDIYPKAVAYVRADGFSPAPIKFLNDGELVAVIMPLTC